MHERRRVVVTGMGIYSPIGNRIEDFEDALLSKRHGIEFMPEWDKIKSLKTRLAGVCPPFDEKRIGVTNRRKMGRVSILACLASLDAIEAAGLDERLVQSERTGVSYGSSAGSALSQETLFRAVLDGDGFNLKGMPSSIYLHFMSHTCAASIAVLLHTKGPCVASSTACTSGAQGIGFAYEQILLGKADIMLAGGAEEMHPMDAAVFDMMLATSSKYNDAPELSPRPFDKDRDGLVVGEGAGTLVLEEYEHAKKRGAPILAELIGYATNSDGHSMTNGRPEGIEAAIRASLKDAHLCADDVDYINAHATATKIGDIAESIATNRVFGEKTPVSCIKGYIGHTLGAAGAIEAIATILMLRGGYATPTLKLETPDERCGKLAHIIGDVRRMPMKIAMTNNFAFGGINTSLIFEKI